jgi:hypothetical protein
MTIFTTTADVTDAATAEHAEGVLKVGLRRVEHYEPTVTRNGTRLEVRIKKDTSGFGWGTESFHHADLVSAVLSEADVLAVVMADEG